MENRSRAFCNFCAGNGILREIFRQIFAFYRVVLNNILLLDFQQRLSTSCVSKLYIITHGFKVVKYLPNLIIPYIRPKIKL